MANKVHFKKNISTFSLMMTGVTSIVGSGWLLSTQRLSNVSGPAALLTWVVGMVVAMLVALCFIEVGSSVPSAGGIGYYSRLTHGRFSGFLTSWINWLSIVTVPAIEAQAIVQYLSQLSPTFMLLYDAKAHMMSNTGIMYAIILMLFFMYINYWSVQLFIRFNNILTVMKVAVPILTIGCLLYIGIHPSNFGHNLQEFAPFGVRSIFVGVVSCGVIMSFNGFQTPMTFSTEIKSPKTQLPIAVLGSILITFVLYLLLQMVFIGALHPLTIINGWEHVNFRSPYVNLLLLANFQVMVWVVYVSSALSPAACGAAFMASSSRMMYALSEDKLLPQYLSYLHPLYRSPRHAVITCTVVGCVYLFIFRSWASLVTVVSVLHLFSYLPAPVIVIANRLKNVANRNGSISGFRLPFASLIAPLIFICLSMLLFLAAWPLTAELAGLVVPGLCFYYYYELRHCSYKKAYKLFKGASWIIFYLIGISIICYIGNNPDGKNLVSFNAAMSILIIFSFLIFIYGAYMSYDNEILPSLASNDSGISKE